MKSHLVTNINETNKLAELIAEKINAGDWITFEGPLGSGKTTIVRQIIRAIIGDESFSVTSPTYNIMQSYDVNLGQIKTVYHFICYWGITHSITNKF